MEAKTHFSKRRAGAVMLVGVLTAAGLTSCSGDSAEPGAGATASGGVAEGTEITFWTPHSTPQRIAIQEQVAAKFEAKTGIVVKVVGLAVADMNQSIVAGAAAGDVPDVALLGPDQVASWSSQGLTDSKAAESIIAKLDEATFSKQALKLVTLDGERAAVPSDGWGELLFYRTDVFDELGLDAPTSLEDVVIAAEATKAAGKPGIVLGTQPADGMARETMEHIGLANNCQMFDGADVALDSKECVNALSIYQKLAEASVPGDQNVESTRAAYLAGDAAMVIWSPHLLDEIANLDANFPVSAKENAENPDFLAQNTGIVGPMTGPDNDKATGSGLTMNYSIQTGAQTEAAQMYVEFVLSEGYIDTLAMTPEGRTPVRTGTTDEPQKFTDEWRALPMGADPANRRPFNEVYSAEAMDAIVEAANTFTRWGFGTENWATAGAAASEKTLVTDLNLLLGGGDPAEYAAHITQAASDLQQENS